MLFHHVGTLNLHWGGGDMRVAGSRTTISFLRSSWAWPSSGTLVLWTVNTRSAHFLHDYTSRDSTACFPLAWPVVVAAADTAVIVAVLVCFCWCCCILVTFLKGVRRHSAFQTIWTWISPVVLTSHRHWMPNEYDVKQSSWLKHQIKSKSKGRIPKIVWIDYSRGLLQNGSALWCWQVAATLSILQPSFCSNLSKQSSGFFLQTLMCMVQSTALCYTILTRHWVWIASVLSLMLLYL